MGLCLYRRIGIRHPPGIFPVNLRYSGQRYKETRCISAITMNDYVRFEVITVVSAEIMVFWKVTLFGSNLLLPSSGFKLAASRSQLPG